MAGAPAASPSPPASSAPTDTLKVIDQGADDTTNAVSIRRFFAKVAGVATTERTTEATHHPDPPPHPGNAAARRPDPGLPGADAGAAVPPGTARRRDQAHACAGRLRADARQAVRGHRPPRPCRHQLFLSRAGQRPLPDVALAHPRLRQPEDGPHARAAALRRRAGEAHLRRPALSPPSAAWTSRTTPSAHPRRRRLRALRQPRELPRRGRHRRPGRPHVRLLRHRLLQHAPRPSREAAE